MLAFDRLNSFITKVMYKMNLKNEMDTYSKAGALAEEVLSSIRQDYRYIRHASLKIKHIVTYH